MEKLRTLFDVVSFGPDEQALILGAAEELKIDPDALSEITSEDCDVILGHLSSGEVLKVMEVWAAQALASAENIFRDQPEGCDYTRYGLSCVVLEGELILGPHLSYDWNGQEEQYEEHVLTLVRTSADEYGLWGSSVESLANWPDVARLPEDDEDDD